MKILLLADDHIRLEPTTGAMTVEAASADQDYSPFHMLASSLAYCTFAVMDSWATHSKQSVDDLSIEVRWTFSEDEPKRVAELRLTYEWPSLPEKKANAARRVAELCTIHATLMHPPSILIEASSTTTATPGADEPTPGTHVPAAASGR